MQIIPKPWGEEHIICQNKHYIVKKLVLFPNSETSLQYHEFKHETIFPIEGTLFIEIEGQQYKSDDFNYAIEISPNVKHRMYTREEGAIYLEVSTPHLDDVIRLEDKYGRV